MQIKTHEPFKRGRKKKILKFHMAISAWSFASSASSSSSTTLDLPLTISAFVSVRDFADRKEKEKGKRDMGWRGREKKRETH